MYKYAGLLIFEGHDDDGILEIIETQGVRSLHFGSSAMQSSMRLNARDNLELSYVRAMMSWLLFRDSAKQALMLGLGGGSLAKYLLYHFDDIQIKAVEYRQSVVKIARRYFDLPLDPRLKVIVDDAGWYLRQRSEQLAGHYDLLFLDAFDHNGMAESLCNPAFFDACRQVLTDDGVLVLNLWSCDKTLLDTVSWWVGQSFAGRLLFLPVPDKGNIIGVAFAENSTRYSLKALRQRALALEAHYQIEFPLFLRNLRSAHEQQGLLPPWQWLST